MFGHDDDQPKNDSNTSNTTPLATIEPATDAAAPADTSATPASTDDVKAVSLSTPTVVVEPSKSETDSADPVSGVPDISIPEESTPAADAPASPKDSGSAPLSSLSSLSAPAEDSSSSVPPASPLSDVPDVADTPAPADAGSDGAAMDGVDGLLSIKQEALGQLSPLVDHLDQTADEKFHTTMMMIQASDDKTLIQKAFDAAKEITDDKERAQALLDIINEINYFTQHNSTEQ